MLLGVSPDWISDRSEIQHPRRNRPTHHAEPLGRLIRGQLREQMAIGDKGAYRRRFEPWDRIGDLRECLRQRDNPDVPEGGRLINRAIVPELAKEGIRINRDTLV